MWYMAWNFSCFTSVFVPLSGVYGKEVTHELNLNDLGSGPLDEATYKISKAWDFWFQMTRF